jgi:hypothetical protein
MKHLEELKEVVKRELEKFGKQGDISVSNLEKIHKLSDLYKNLCKIEMLEEEGGYSEGYMDDGVMHGSSYARGRRYVKRDSMGRYSRDGGYSEDDDYSERRMGRGYSRDEATDHLMRQLGAMMEDADPKQRETLKKWMRELERD